MNKSKLKVEYVSISKLKPFEGNPRKNDESVEAIVKSIEAFGFTNPILVRKADNVIIAGHTRLKALQQLGKKQAPVIFLDLDETDSRVYAIFDNKSVELAEWDNLKLADLFTEFDQLDADLDLTGFTTEEIDDIVVGPTVGLTDDDAVPEPPKEPITKTGDLWLLGGHRLLCGDCTIKVNIERLIGQEKADMVFTDPPYGISVVGQNGTVGGRNLAAVGNYSKVVGDESTKTAEEAYNILRDFGIDRMIIWGGNYFSDFLPPSPCWIVWDKRGEIVSNNFADCELAWSTFKSPARIYKQIWMGMIKEGEHSKRVHPTQKPIKILEDIIKEYVDKDGIVLDLFLGSGSTLIACEKTNRKCYGMEIDPIYCDVIVKRWEDFTGKKAELAKKFKKNLTQEQ